MNINGLQRNILLLSMFQLLLTKQWTTEYTFFVHWKPSTWISFTSLVIKLLGYNEHNYHTYPNLMTEELIKIFSVFVEEILQNSQPKEKWWKTVILIAPSQKAQI